MENSQNQINAKSLKLIFYIQIALLSLLAILFTIGYTDLDLHVGAYFFSIILGALGSTISLMKRIRHNAIIYKQEYEELKIFSILMPILYGTLLAGIAYLLFMSGILSGEGGNGILTTNLFPNFTKSNLTTNDILKQFIEIRPVSIQDTGKLLVWCFIAGYSERFVIGILDQLENKGSI